MFISPYGNSLLQIHYNIGDDFLRKTLLKFGLIIMSALSLISYPIANAQKVELAKQKVGDIFETDGGKFEIIKKNDVNETLKSGPFELTINYIASIKLDPTEAITAFVEPNKDGIINLIAVHLTAENTSDDTLSFYPDQSTMVTNKKQLEADFLFSASIGGDFYGNVEKEGLVYFIYEEDLRDVDKMRLFVKGAVDNDFNKVGEDIELELKFK